VVTVASKELENCLGRYLQMVREGWPVRIIDRGKPIGYIVPLEGPPQSTELARLFRLQATGGLTLGSGSLQPHRKRARLKPGPSATLLVANERR
jgi:antitoxin (DNA-binding transcriptional repressor) of toxin-antitoxin stability system